MKSIGEHAGGLVKFAIIIFSGAFIVMGIIWIFRGIGRLLFGTNTKNITDEDIQKTMEYYRIHGVYCPHCDTYVPDKHVCDCCGELLPDTVELMKIKWD